ncbi:MAG: T9SS type A sorting domain-containing protein [Bacteroidia bacterium]
MGGYPFANQIDTLEFWYKYLPEPNDTAYVWLNFKKNGVNIYGTGIGIYQTEASWTYNSIPFNIGQKPDSVIIEIASSSHSNDTSNTQYGPYVGSTLIIDNLEFASQPLGVNQLPVQAGIKVYPDPAKNQINVDLTNVSGSLQKIALYDMSGRMLSSVAYKDGVRNNIETIDISGFSAGMYMIEVTTDNGKFYQKINKE